MSEYHHCGAPEIAEQHASYSGIVGDADDVESVDRCSPSRKEMLEHAGLLDSQPLVHHLFTQQSNGLNEFLQLASDRLQRLRGQLRQSTVRPSGTDSTPAVLVDAATQTESFSPQTSDVRHWMEQGKQHIERLLQENEQLRQERDRLQQQDG
ncbi:hypothetical protein PHYPSEUDO_000434 [Phytophthora pseudosyringae]|uniref:Uncharacterized protein n=1 Tax=Phytophthora pseudosyringae TaxID=221518 RepID=A0A8T1VZE0_9STRA|nr:hypothetical protein PHYPSEUDO_000434 [Phytophthora pseudosyringae]